MLSFCVYVVACRIALYGRFVIVAITEIIILLQKTTPRVQFLLGRVKIFNNTNNIITNLINRWCLSLPIKKHLQERCETNILVSPNVDASLQNGITILVVRKLLLTLPTRGKSLFSTMSFLLNSHPLLIIWNEDLMEITNYLWVINTRCT